MQRLLFAARKPHLLLAIVIGIAVFALYGHAFSGEFIFWDDDLLVTDNPYVRAITPWTLWKIFSTYDPELYIPVTLFSYQIDFAIGGLQPYVYHFTNALIHISSSIIVSVVAYRLSGKRFTVAAVSGLLFAVHPLHTEAVMWIAARKDLLSGLFFFLTYACFLRWYEEEKPVWYGVSVVAFLAGLLSKVMIAPLPIVLLITIWFISGRITRRDVQSTLPFFALSLFFGIVALFGKTGQVGVVSVWEMLLMGSRSIVLYVSHFFVPIHLSLFYPFTESIALANAGIFFSVLAVVSALCGSAFLRKRNRLWLFAFLFLCITVAPTFISYRLGSDAGDVYMGNDRYVYIGSFVLFYMVSLGLSAVIDRFRVMGIALVSIIVITLSLQTVRQSNTWKSNEALFTHSLSLYPNAQAAHNNIGVYYYKKGNLQAAADHFTEAIKLSPLPSSLSNLASVYRAVGKLPEAESLLQKALNTNPNSYRANFNAGLLYMQKQQWIYAEKYLKKAVELRPYEESAHLNLGAMYAQTSKLDEAISEYQSALEINPFYANGYFNIGMLYRRTGNEQKAVESLKRALQLDPKLLPARQALER